MDTHQASPGDRSENRTKREAEELTAELCINCNDDDVKQVLKKYQYGHTIGDIEGKMKKGTSFNLTHLTKTLKFLNNTAITDKLPKRRMILFMILYAANRISCLTNAPSVKFATNLTLWKNHYYNAPNVAKALISAAS